MEQTLRSAKRPHAARLFPYFGTPSLLISITLVILVGFLTVLLLVNTLAKVVDKITPPDPFATFTDYFPGQHLDIQLLEAKGFSCHLDTQPSPADITERCFRVLKTGAFSEISVTVWDGIVKWVDFAIRDQSLTVGDLSLRFGSPDIRMSGDRMDVSWPDRNITASGKAHNGRFTYFLSVSQIQLN